MWLIHSRNLPMQKLMLSLSEKRVINNNQQPEEMGFASKTSCNTIPATSGEVDTVVMLKPKQMEKEKMTGGAREHGRKKLQISL